MYIIIIIYLFVWLITIQHNVYLVGPKSIWTFLDIRQIFLDKKKKYIYK